MPAAPRHRSSAVPLAWLYGALLVYASLYPFTPWRVPGVALDAWLRLPWPRYWTWFDLTANFLGYLPFGGLVYGAIVRSGGRSRTALVAAFATGTGLSLALETLQNFLPQRVASNVDLGVNAAGTLLGALLGGLVQARGGVERWQRARDLWFIGRSRGALALLVLWPVGLLFPLPVPLAQGQVLEQLQRGVVGLVDGTPVAPWFAGWGDPGFDPAGLSPAVEFALIALGLLGPCLVAFSVSRRGWRRLVLALGAAASGASSTTLSTALNFGPQHVDAWLTTRALAALGFALALAAALSWLPRRAAAGAGLVALTALVTVVMRAPADPFFAQSLQFWEQGRFIRFYGVARWVGWLWPYAAILYLLTRIGSRDDTSRIDE